MLEISACDVGIPSMDNNSVTKSFRIAKDIDPKRVTNLPQIITLMMFKDAILTSIRWKQSLNEDDSVESFAGLTLSVACGFGWAAEAVRFLKDLHKERILENQMIERLPVLSPVNPRKVWEECVMNTSSRMGRLHRVRDAGFAHFYDRNEEDYSKRYGLAANVIDALASGQIDVPFVEWTEIDGKKSNSKSCSPVAMVAIISSMFDEPADDALEHVRQFGNQVLEIGILLENILAIMVADTGLRFESYE